MSYQSTGIPGIQAPPPVSPGAPLAPPANPQGPEPLPADTFANEWRNFQLPELSPPDNSQYLDTIEQRYQIPVLIQQIRSMQ